MELILCENQEVILYSEQLLTNLFVGEFTQENQRKIKDEEEKDLAKIDPWKVRLIIKNMYMSLILSHMISFLFINVY